MRKSTTSFLVDVNVWLALAYDQHEHHALAAGWFTDVDAGEAGFCRLTQLGLLRLLTNARVMGRDVLSQAKAWQLFDRLLGDERVRFLAEPLGLDDEFRKRTQSSHASVNAWPDAYLAAFAVVSGLKVVTLDRAFRRMTGVEIAELG
jgi:hypothetical protein